MNSCTKEIILLLVIGVILLVMALITYIAINSRVNGTYIDFFKTLPSTNQNVSQSTSTYSNSFALSYTARLVLLIIGAIIFIIICVLIVRKLIRDTCIVEVNNEYVPKTSSPVKSNIIGRNQFVVDDGTVPMRQGSVDKKSFKTVCKRGSCGLKK